jgi:transcriptional regulator with XRE-family HTH domain
MTMTDSTQTAFAAALEAHLSEHAEDLTSLANRAGVSRNALYKVRYGKTKSPSVDIAIKVARAYGETVEEFMGLTPVEIRDELLAEIAQLSPSERSVLHAALMALRRNQSASDAKTGSDE